MAPFLLPKISKIPKYKNARYAKSKKGIQGHKSPTKVAQPAFRHVQRVPVVGQRWHEWCNAVCRRRSRLELLVKNNFKREKFEIKNFSKQNRNFKRKNEILKMRIEIEIKNLKRILKLIKKLIFV